MRAELPTIHWSGAVVRTVDIEGRLAQSLTPDTLAHVYRSAEFARGLAERHGVDPDRAELAALLHEIADRYRDDELLALAERYEIVIDPIEARVPRLLHGRVGAEILRLEWGITDEELLEAVRYHMAGAPRMGILAKIIFLADKLEPNRDKFYGDLGPVRKLAMTDLDAAIARLSVWRVAELPSLAAVSRDPIAEARSAVIEHARATWG